MLFIICWFGLWILGIIFVVIRLVQRLGELDWNMGARDFECEISGDKAFVVYRNDNTNWSSKNYFVYKHGKWKWDWIKNIQYIMIKECGYMFVVLVMVMEASGAWAEHSTGKHTIIFHMSSLIFVIMGIIACSEVPLLSCKFLNITMRNRKKPIDRRRMMEICKSIVDTLIQVYYGELEIIINPFEPYSYDELKHKIDKYVRENQCARITMPSDKYWENLVNEEIGDGSGYRVEIDLWFDYRQSDLILCLEVRNDGSYLIRDFGEKIV